MQLFEYADDPLKVDGFLFGCQVAARFQGFKHVLHAGQREARMLGLLDFSVAVDSLTQ